MQQEKKERVDCCVVERRKVGSGEEGVQFSREKRAWTVGARTQREGECSGCVCEIQPSCSAGNNGREASVEMQIRERVADSLIHVRGLWFRATRTAAYIRGIKEFVLEFCTAGGGGEALYNVTRPSRVLPSGHPRRLSHLRPRVRGLSSLGPRPAFWKWPLIVAREPSTVATPHWTWQNAQFPWLFRW